LKVDCPVFACGTFWWHTDFAVRRTTQDHSALQSASRPTPPHTRKHNRYQSSWPRASAGRGPTSTRASSTARPARWPTRCSRRGARGGAACAAVACAGLFLLRAARLC
jgi:hypothetical protein